MFIRFSKGAAVKGEKKRKYRKSVLLNDTLIMEYGSDIVGIAKLHEETERAMDYDIVVAGQNELGAECIARYIKNMIGSANKFSDNPSSKRRKYYVDVINDNSLKLNVNISFKRR